MSEHDGRKPRLRGGPLSGLAVFCLTIALMIFAAAPAQYYWGMAGLVLTELMLAGIAVGFALVFRARLREVFPVSLPSGRETGAALILWLAYLGLAMAATMLTACIFPEQVFGVGEQLGEVFNSVPLPLTLAAAALMPAVCEEMLCRGFLQHTFRAVKARWVVIAAMAVLFGVLHLSLYRFLPTAILGFALAYLREKSGSLVLPALVHFVNNAFSTAGSYISAGSADAALTAETLAILPALAFFYALGSPLLIYLGTGMFSPPPPLGTRRTVSGARRAAFIAAIAATALIALGFALTSQPFLEQIANNVTPV